MSTPGAYASTIHSDHALTIAATVLRSLTTPHRPLEGAVEQRLGVSLSQGAIARSLNNVEGQ